MTREDPAFTADERQALRLVGARARMDRGDVQPMLRVLSRTEAEVIPWLAALNLDVPRLARCTCNATYGQSHTYGCLDGGTRL